MKFGVSYDVTNGVIMMSIDNVTETYTDASWAGIEQCTASDVIIGGTDSDDQNYQGVVAGFCLYDEALNLSSMNFACLGK